MRTVLLDLQKRAREFKAQGVIAEAAGQTLASEFDVKYPDWKGLGRMPTVVRRFYEEVQ